jgi:hypothetical protein
MNEDQLSPANEFEREAFALAKRAFQNGASLAALCRALASCIEVGSANTLALESSGEPFTLAHVACLSFSISAERAALMARWLRETAARLDMLPADAAELTEIMRSDGATYAAFEAKLFGEAKP